MRISSILAVAAFVALVACQNTDPNQKDSKKSLPAAVKGADNKTYKFAFVNTDTLLEKYNFYKDMKKDLETRERIIDADLRNKKAGFDSEVIMYQKGVSGMSIDQAKRTEQGLGIKEQELMQYKQTVETDFVKQGQELNKKLNNNINDFVKKYAEQNGYTFIFSYSKNATGVGMLYGQDALDITADVLKGLNAEYKPEKKQ